MAQISEDGDNIDAFSRQNRDQCMPEGMGIDVGKVVFGREIPEPAGYSIRSGRTAIFTAKYIAGLDPILAGLRFPLTLILLQCLEKIHSFLREIEDAPIAGLGLAFQQSIRLALHKRAVDADGSVLPINLFPTQSNGFAPAAAGNNQKVDQGPPAQARATA